MLRNVFPAPTQCDVFDSRWGNTEALWQHRVAPLPGVMAGDLDQDVAREVPLLTTLDAPGLLPLDLDWDAVRRDRDDFIKDKEP